jgi:hypothetical protein
MSNLKQKSVSEIKERIGGDMMVYNAIRAGRKKAAVAANLLGSQAHAMPLMEGLVDWVMVEFCLGA